VRAPTLSHLIVTAHKIQESAGMVGGLKHYSNCKTGKNATAYAIPARCFAPLSAIKSEAAPVAALAPSAEAN